MISLIRFLIRLGWPLRLARPLLGRFNPFDPRRRTDPYPLYERMRREEPISLSRMVGIWFLFRHRDVEAVLKDPRFSVRRSDHATPALNPLLSLSPEFQAFANRTLLMVDP